MSQKAQNGADSGDEHEAAPEMDTTGADETVANAGTDKARRRGGGGGGGGGAKRSAATPLAERSFAAFFAKPVVARAAKLAKVMGALPKDHAQIVALDTAAYTTPFFMRGSDMGAEGDYELLLRHEEEAVVALEVAHPPEEYTDEGEADGDGDGDKAAPLVPGFTTPTPKKHDAAYPAWLAELFGADGTAFFSSLHVNVVRHRESGAKHWVVNATRLPGAGKVFMRSVTKKAALVDRGAKVGRERLATLLAASQERYAEALVTDPDTARTNDDEHLYVELSSNRDVSCFPCERAFLAGMPVEMILARADITGYVSPRHLCNVIVAALKRSASRANKSAAASAGGGGEESAAAPPSKRARAEGAQQQQHGAANGAAKKTSKDARAEATALNVHLPVAPARRAGDSDDDGDAEGADDLPDPDAPAESVLEAAAANVVDFESIEQIEARFSKDIAAVVADFDNKAAATAALTRGISPDGLIPEALVARVKPERAEAVLRFLGATAPGGACREVVQALLLPPDEGKRADRIVETLNAVASCLAAKSDALANAPPEKLRAEFDALMGLFAADQARAPWRQQFMPEGKPLDTSEMLKKYAHPQTSPIARAFFMPGLLAGAVCAADHYLKQMYQLGERFRQLTEHYNASLQGSSKAVSDAVARANVQLALLQKKLQERAASEKAAVVQERDDAQAQLVNAKAELQRRATRIEELEAKLREATARAAAAPAKSDGKRPAASAAADAAEEGGGGATAPATKKAAAAPAKPAPPAAAAKPVPKTVPKPVPKPVPKSVPKAAPEPPADHEMAPAAVNQDDCF